MATTADAEVILKLYELRREATMRTARTFLIFEFNPMTAEELFAVTRAPGSEHNGYFRQVISYWEMAASFCLRGAVDNDLFLDTNNEPFFLYAKFSELYQTSTGQPFMPNLTKLIQTHKAAQAKHEAMLKTLAARKAQATRDGSLDPASAA